MKKLANWLISALMVAGFGGALLTAVVPEPVYAADNCNQGFLGFPAWYRGLTDGNCDIASPDSVGGLSNFIWRIVINVVEIFLMLVGYISVGFVIYGGFLLMSGRGNPGDIAEGQKTIRNAIIWFGYINWIGGGN